MCYFSVGAILHYTMPQVVDTHQHAQPSYLLEPISMSKQSEHPSIERERERERGREERRERE